MSKKKRRGRQTTKNRGSRQTWWMAMTAFVAISTVAVLGLSATGNKGSSDTPDAGRYDDIPRGVTEDGMPRLGDPDAPIVVEEVSDFT